MTRVNVAEERAVFNAPVLVLLTLQFLVSLAISESKIRIAPDGGYSDIVVKIDKDVDERSCATYITHLTVRNINGKKLLCAARRCVGSHKFGVV